MYKIYQIKEGENLDIISKKLGISKKQLQEINGLNDNSILNSGDLIVIPQNNDSLFQKYIVTQGDTIYEIGKKTNTDYNQILKINGLNKYDYIYPNQEILIPNAGVKIYVTETGDTIGTISNKLGINLSDAMKQNSNITLLPDQLVVYKND